MARVISGLKNNHLHAGLSVVLSGLLLEKQVEDGLTFTVATNQRIVEELFFPKTAFDALTFCPSSSVMPTPLQIISIYQPIFIWDDAKNTFITVVCPMGGGAVLFPLGGQIAPNLLESDEKFK